MARYKEEYDIPEYDIEIITASKRMADLFEETVAICKQPKKVSNLVSSQRLVSWTTSFPSSIKSICLALSPSMARAIGYGPWGYPVFPEKSGGADSDDGKEGDQQFRCQGSFWHPLKIHISKTSSWLIQPRALWKSISNGWQTGKKSPLRISLAFQSYCSFNEILCQFILDFPKKIV